MSVMLWHKVTTARDCCSPDKQETWKKSNRDEIEDGGEHSLHWWDDEAAMYHKLTQCCRTFVAKNQTCTKLELISHHPMIYVVLSNTSQLPSRTMHRIHVHSFIAINTKIPCQEHENVSHILIGLSYTAKCRT